MSTGLNKVVLPQLRTKDIVAHAGHVSSRDELDELEADEDSIDPEIVVSIVNLAVILRKLLLVGLVDEGNRGNDAGQEVEEDGEDE